MTGLAERGRAVVAHGGDRVAGLDRRRLAHRALVRAIQIGLPRRFNPEAAQGLDAVFELRIRDPGQRAPVCFELVIHDGQLTVHRRPADNAVARVAIGADDIVRLVSGAEGFAQVLAKKRMDLTGDPFVALRFPGLFGMTSPP